MSGAHLANVQSLEFMSSSFYLDWARRLVHSLWRFRELELWDAAAYEKYSQRHWDILSASQILWDPWNPWTLNERHWDTLNWPLKISKANGRLFEIPWVRATSRWSPCEPQEDNPSEYPKSWEGPWKIMWIHWKILRAREKSCEPIGRSKVPLGGPLKDIVHLLENLKGPGRSYELLARS